MRLAPGVRPLADLCEAVTVGHVGKTSQYYRAEGVPFLRTQNVGYGDLVLDDLKFITQDFHDSLKKSQLKSGDVLVTRVVTDEMKCGIVPPDLGRANCANVILIRPKPELRPEFLSYLITSPVAQSYLLERRVGSAQQVVNTRVLKEWPVPELSIEEQKRIVAVLDQAFAALDRARAHAEANLVDAQVLFTTFVASKFSKRNEWPSEELGCRVHFVDYRGKTPPKSESGIRLITAKNVRMGFVKEDPREFVPESAYKEWMTRGIPKVGDVLFTTEAPLANVAQLETDERVVIGQRLITMQTKHDEIDSGFLKWSLISSQMQSDIHSRGTGATVLGIKASLLKKILLYVPKSIELQKRIASDCEAAFATKTQLEKQYSAKLADLARLRQSLLQKAFSGELT